ncbi:hypothetical protein [Pedobacter glucosidilyticus]|uniref:hypothetical protein n=1 Tax=Pedobacter glucosidilyticus TaxID=1122941 RepID=UPI0026EC568B|nr:hypothetical protein [Pedobacter glucosidilyticus]
MKSAEEKIWNYIDGLCSKEEALEIERLLREDISFQNLYQEILSFDEHLKSTDLEEPSMGFSFAVMDKIRLQAQPLSLKAQVDKRIIYGIAASFILILSVIMAVAIAQTNWSASSGSFDFNMNYDAFKISEGFSRTAIQAFLFFDIIIMLLTVDYFLRKRSKLS